ncbi:hypothetical protein HYALB_00013748, partial [Hymenoscyphus albidus]
IFIIEGLATIAYAILAKCFIVDWPETAAFLTAEEKLLLSRRLDEDRGNEFARMDRLDKHSFNRIMKDWKIWAGVKYLATFFVATGTYITQPLVIVWLSNNLGAHYKRAFGTAMQIGFGDISGIIGSFIFIQNEGPGFKTGYGSALGMVLVCGVACTVFHFGVRWENGKRERGERNDRLRLSEAEVQNLGDDHPGFRFSG